MEKSVFCNTLEPMHKQVLDFQAPCFIISLFSAEFIGFLLMVFVWLCLNFLKTYMKFLLIFWPGNQGDSYMDISHAISCIFCFYRTRKRVFSEVNLELLLLEDISKSEMHGN